MDNFNILDHKVYGKVLAQNGKIHILPIKEENIAKKLAEQYNGKVIKSMAGNWVIKISEEHGAGFQGTDELVNNYKRMTPGQSTLLVKKNKYTEDGKKPAVKVSIKEWIEKPETIALYIDRYGSEEIARQELEKTARKLVESLDNNEIIRNKNTIEQIRKKVNVTK